MAGKKMIEVRGTGRSVKERRMSQTSDPGDRQGRPTLYRPWVLDDVAKYTGEDGAGTITEMARYLGVGNETITGWMEQHEEFREAMRAVRRRIDEKVEQALYKRAVGYTIPNNTKKTEKVIVKGADITGIELDDDDEEFTVEGEKIVLTEAQTHIPADVTAGKFWLGIRNPEEWRETKKIEIEGSAPWGELLRRVDEALIEDAEYEDLTPEEDDDDDQDN